MNGFLRAVLVAGAFVAAGTAPAGQLTGSRSR
jgi:hypothetical protein